VHGQVGLPHQRLGLGAIADVGRDPDAGRDDQLLRPDDERRCQRVEHTLGDQRRVLVTGDRLGDHGELVATQPRYSEAVVVACARHGVVAAQAARQHLRHMLEEPVAGLVAEAVVYGLEAVDVEQHQGHRTPGLARASHRPPEPLPEQGPVREPGQAVVLGKVVRAPPVAQVAHADEVLLRSVARQPGDAELDWGQGAVRAPDPHLAVAQRGGRGGARRRRHAKLQSLAGQRGGRLAEQPRGRGVAAGDLALGPAQHEAVRRTLEDQAQQSPQIVALGPDPVQLGARRDRPQRRHPALRAMLGALRGSGRRRLDGIERLGHGRG
jgi:hypothetical protein